MIGHERWKLSGARRRQTGGCPNMGGAMPHCLCERETKEGRKKVGGSLEWHLPKKWGPRRERQR